MRLEDQVVSLELAKKLKELGVKQESLFYYLPMYDGTHHILFYRELTHSINYYISAFTVAELGEMLPDYIELTKVKNIHLATIYSEDNGTENNVSVIDDTEANSRAKMLIYLIEQGLYKL